MGPDRSRVDYDYVMEHLFLYVLTTLDQLVAEDYNLIYFHGATPKNCIPRFSWVKRLLPNDRSTAEKEPQATLSRPPNHLVESCCSHVSPIHQCQIQPQDYVRP